MPDPTPPQVDPVAEPTTEPKAGQNLPLTKDPNADLAELQDALKTQREANETLRRHKSEAKQRERELTARLAALEAQVGTPQTPAPPTAPQPQTPQPQAIAPVLSNNEAEHWRTRAIVAEMAAGIIPIELIDLKNADPDDAEDLQYRIDRAKARFSELAERHGYAKAGAVNAPPVPLAEPPPTGAAPTVPIAPAPTTDTDGTPLGMSPATTLEGRLKDAWRRVDEAKAAGNPILEKAAVNDVSKVRTECTRSAQGLAILKKINDERYGP